MKKKSDSPSTLSRVNEMFQNDKQDHQQAVNKRIEETYYAPEAKQTIKEYEKKKKMKWWTYLLALFATLILTAISVVLWYKTTHEIANYYNLILGFSIIVVMMSLNFWKNHQAAKYFNDKRRRYQRTFSNEEANIFLINKSLFLILLLFLPVLISFAVLM